MAIFDRTNENLAAIVKGLDVRPDDFILAVGGSGDQAFALLEQAKKVIAVDIKKDQVQHMEKLAEFLREGNYEDFLAAHVPESVAYRYKDLPYVNGLYGWNLDLDSLLRWDKEHGTEYFTLQRLDRIREKLDALEIREENILETIRKEEGFNKVYLSNAFGFEGFLFQILLAGERHYIGVPEVLQALSEKLPSGGLVHASNGYLFEEYLEGLDAEVGFVVDKCLTHLSKEKLWSPAVLRKC